MECRPSGPMPLMGVNETKNFSMANNMGPPQLPPEVLQIFSTMTIMDAVSFAILCPLIIVCNVVVIVVFASMGKLNGQSTYKISIAVSDLIFGAVAFPLLTAFTFTNRANAVLLNAFLFIQRVSLMVSLCVMLAMGFDRLYAVLRPLNYGPNKSKKVAMIVTLVIWCAVTVLTLIIAILAPISTDPNDEGRLEVEWANRVGETVVLVIVLLSVWINNFTVYRVVKKKLSVIDSGDNSSISRLNRQRDVVITLCFMTGTFTFSTLPLVVYNIIVTLDKCKLDKLEYAIPSLAVSICFVTNCVWNCFVYSFRNKKFRDQAKVIFLRREPEILSGSKQGTFVQTNTV